ncbi:hypothetical protein HdH2rev_00115 [Escherichia phage vB_EcoS_HdH2]|uniref:Uncharacterized protein n=3 Tax=Viruses TaxID=10239 RepID=A0A3P4A7S2_9CAUD|nr:hypothetical protein HOV62_gp023 [Escherichia phage vB_Eco_mar004NP2]YP_009843410.1 hypothetical protein HWC04_gp145 [Escherichia phage vB_EcoS_HdH2]WNT48425.1 hypothetical protein SPLA5b_PHROGS00083 [Salmonella phage SPLA5b]WOZ54420.1 hypothetical protein Elw_00117 [Escherichia phage vB_EcoD-Elw]QBQ81189.1 hypothetical protein HdH2rev_00115 [Escherichia phage vB_EcoS_HdH2]VCU43438.1 hypothetical protein MAR004NP2_00023 [Escherichia phage vB_Eco_mar004NP2]
MSILLSALEAKQNTIAVIKQEVLNLESLIAVEIDKAIKEKEFNCHIQGLTEYSENARNSVMQRLTKLGYVVEAKYEQREGFWLEIDWSK